MGQSWRNREEEDKKKGKSRVRFKQGRALSLRGKGSLGSGGKISKVRDGEVWNEME